MKKHHVLQFLQVCLLLLMMITGTATWAQVGIGTTKPSTALDISSTNEGLLIPRVALMGANDSITVATPTASELVYNTTATTSGATADTPGYYHLNTAAGPRVKFRA
jgi:hypothetical protein